MCVVFCRKSFNGYVIVYVLVILFQFSGTAVVQDKPRVSADVMQVRLCYRSPAHLLMKPTRVRYCTVQCEVYCIVPTVL